jgi:hypothetical protein
MTDAERDAAASDIAVLKEQIVMLKEHIAHERELREQATAMADIERDRQAAEYERRLEELNGAHARALQDRTELVQKSVYDLTQRDLAAWKLQVTTENTLLAERLRGDQVTTADRLRKDAADMALAIARNQRLVSLILGGLMFALAVANFFLAQSPR